MEPWRVWAKVNKAAVYETAQKYSGLFFCLLIEAYLQADQFNTILILNMWPDKFMELYELWQKEQPVVLNNGG